MSRSAAGGHAVNLMPLLDVLLCTMGTLIVILGVINREARLHPSKRMVGTPAAKAEEMANAREDFELRVSQLSEARDKTREDLQVARTRLSGIEDHSRQLADELRRLSDAAKELNTTAADDAQRESLRRELAEVNSKRLEIEKNLSRARSEAAHRQPAYAVVPFEGMYKTNRRPIYIECRADEVILQPEGLVFTETDFLGPGGPGNPLASALRAAQEYWRAAPKPAPELPNEPYPLLLVRPDGIIAYYLVRDAMTSWDAEFGYELIGQDWKLDFPVQLQPQLKEMERQAVAEARERLQWLAQTSPDLFSRKSNNKTQYHVTPFRGGVAREGGPSLGNDPFQDDPLGGFGRNHSRFSPGGDGDSFGGGGNGGSPGTNSIAGLRGNSAFGTDSVGTGTGNGGMYGGMNGGMPGGGLGSSPGIAGGSVSGPFGLPAGQPGGGPGFPGGAPGNPFGSPGAGQLGGGGLLDASGGSGRGGSNGGGRSAGGPEVASVGPRYAGQGTGGSDFVQAVKQPAPMENLPAETPAQGNGTGGGGAPSSSEYGGVMLPNSTGGMMNSGDAAGSNSQSAGGETANGQYSANGGNASGAQSSSFAGGNSSSLGGSPGDPSGVTSLGSTSGDPNAAAGAIFGQPSAPSPSPMMSKYYDDSNQQSQQSPQRSQQSSMSKRRGRNWALPNKGLASVPIQRSIRVACWADRLVLLPDTRDQQAQVIPLPELTDDAVDQLVSAVGTYTKSWGIAGRGMYWRPQLVLDVQPNADRRAADLQEILADSGWDVKRR